MKSQRLCAVGIVCAGDQVATCADNFVLGKRQLHVEGSEIGEEFRCGMKLVAIPLILPPHTNLREPLTHHEEVALVAGACENLRQHILKVHVEYDRGAGKYRLWKRDLKDCVVVRVVVVGPNELHLGGEVTHAFDYEFANRDRAEMLGIPSGVGSRVAGAIEVNFGHKRRLRLKSIQVEMEGK